MEIDIVKYAWWCQCSKLLIQSISLKIQLMTCIGQKKRKAAWQLTFLSAFFQNIDHVWHLNVINDKRHVLKMQDKKGLQ